MAVDKSTIKTSILNSINGNGKDNDLTPEQSIDKFAGDLAQIIKDAITSGDVKIIPTELTTKVTCASPGSPVVCTQNLAGTIS